MTLARGVVEMLEKANKKPCRFTEFTEIEIKEQHLSSSTVSKRLKELVPLKMLTEEETTDASGRKQTVYAITERGKKVVALADEFRKIMRE